MTNQQKLLKTFDEIGVHYVVKKHAVSDKYSYVFLVAEHKKEEYEKCDLIFMCREKCCYFEFYQENGVGYS